ncbi:GNAT superfamily N-acetyltransferase [Alkalibacillus filiformis]|uniref:GNAT superfamily N-acetyltransferase n=1 Tax=Alkalibacillus filiformis TaxID=200990 RepID=A0ABU0DXF3_9BACI|nr:GNAT family N-acetyltransferase [Alkalibacillus filiformis]MDQ0352989.1 GNAT superfamily N-acetyltransferase [Alkalibacillus filiformis]
MILDAKHEDLQSLAYLMGELGYPTTTDEMNHRMMKINASDDYRTLVYEQDGKVVGMTGLIRGFHYENNNNYIRIVALVVDSGERRSGIGKALLDAAEQWAKEQKASKLVLNSGNRDDREDAHHFYTSQGYEAKATGFYKKLN